MKAERTQSAYSDNRFALSQCVDDDIRSAVERYLIDDLGSSLARARQRALLESERRIPRTVLDDLARQGIDVNGARVLDLGAGLGGMTEELVLRGASVVAIEPGAAWAQIAFRRVTRHGGDSLVVRAAGERIPLADASVDLIVSYRVLEHVNDPLAVLQEAWRVLKPGGAFLLTCENYLAFREAHYGVFWLPLLPKTLGAGYLRMRGRPPRFLMESVTYTTYPGVLAMCRQLGFSRQRDEQLAASLASKSGLKWTLLRALAWLSGGRLPTALDRALMTFKFGLEELFFKRLPSR